MFSFFSTFILFLDLTPVSVSYCTPNRPHIFLKSTGWPGISIDLIYSYEGSLVHLQLAAGQVSSFANVGWVPHISRATAGTAGLT